MRSTMLSVLSASFFAPALVFVPVLSFASVVLAQTEASTDEPAPAALEVAAGSPPAPSAVAPPDETAALASTPPSAPATLPAPPDPTVDRVFEMFWAASGILAFGLSPALSTRVDFAFAVDRQWLVGPQLSVAYGESVYMGPPDTTTLSTTVTPGLFIQHYFIPPATGGVMPTLRIGLGLSYTENSTTAGMARSASVFVGANAAVSGGVTWLPEPWLGVRIIGGATSTVSIAVEGMPQQVNASLGVFAEAGVVVRI